MATLLPRVMVGRHEYEVDMPAGELRSVKDQSKALELFKMDPEGDNLAFWYNHETQKIVANPSSEDQKKIERISLPLESLDLEFMKKIASETRETETLIRSGKSIYSNPGGIHAATRITVDQPRLLPMINLYGTEFFLDLRLKELREVNNIHNKIPWHALEQTEFHFLLMYDTTTKNVFTGTEEQAKQRDDVRELILPPLDIMIRDGVQRHKDQIDRACDFIDTEMQKELDKGDDEYYEIANRYRADPEKKVTDKKTHRENEGEKRTRRKGRRM